MSDLDKIERRLEIIVCSVSEAREAELGGAHRLEVVRDLDLGGLTPSVPLVREILRAVGLPLRVMLREGVARHLGSPSEVQRLRDKAAEFSGLGIEGLVLGCLTQDGQIDLNHTRVILAAAPNLKATFHRAFDEVVDPLKEIKRLKRLSQIDRILTDGGPGTWEEKGRRLMRYQKAASPEITIMAGGGLNPGLIRSLCAQTSLPEFHAGRAARVPPAAEGTVRRARVQELAAALRPAQLS